MSLKTWFETVDTIIFDVNISLNNLTALESAQDITADIVKQYGFFDHYRYQLRFISIVQLAKLLCEKSNQKFNLIKLFRKIKAHDFDTEIDLLIRSNVLKHGRVYRTKGELIGEIDGLLRQFEKYRETIAKLELARDRVYAHTDNVSVELISNQELDDLKTLVTRMYKVVHDRLYAIDTGFGNSIEWHVLPILERLRREYMDRQRDYDE